MRLDVDEVVALSHPIMMLRAGGRDKYREAIEAAFQSFSALGFAEGSEIVGAQSDQFVDGKTRVVGFPYIRKTKVIGRLAQAYVAISYDAGANWYVFSLTCTDERWLKALAPTYRGEPDILGFRNPAAVRAAAEQDFDETLYLKGAKWSASGS